MRRGRRMALLAGAIGAPLVLTVLLIAPFRWIDPPGSAFIWREHLQSGAPIHRRWVPLDEISDTLVLCVLASEDQKFAIHRGFDFDSIAEALEETPARRRGASTITQQVVKNLYLWPGRSLFRKGLEAYLTVFLETLWPKRRILEVYLNIAEFGPGVFGAAAASERFYGTPPGALSYRQASQLAAVLPNPKELSAARPSPYVSERAAAIASKARRLAGTRLADLAR